MEGRGGKKIGRKVQQINGCCCLVEKDEVNGGRNERRNEDDRRDWRRRGKGEMEGDHSEGIEE